MREVADLGAGPFDDLAIGVDQLIHLGCERRDVLRKLAFDVLGLAAADRGDALSKDPHRAEPVADGERRRADQGQRQRQEGAGQRPFEAALLRLDHVGVGGHLDEETSFLAGVDLALHHAQLTAAGSDHIAAEDLAMVRRHGDEMGSCVANSDFEARISGGSTSRRVICQYQPEKASSNCGAIAGRPAALGLLVGDGQIGDQRLQIDAQLVVEIGLRPAGVERAEAQARQGQG